MRMLIAAVLATFVAPPLHADEAADALFTAADIALLGEVHDNQGHHLEQARIVTLMQPTALVFEMLTPAQVVAAEGVDRREMAALAGALGWADSGWPDFQIYAPVFAAAPMAQLYGAGLPRAEARAAYSNGISDSFGAFSEAYGLTKDLPADQMQARLTLQFQAHCEAIPRENLTPMVALQRLRDAYLARAAMQALLETGGPVAVITGNGHARSDWGATALIRQLDAEVTVIALGQSEDGQTPDGGFDLIIDSPGVDRGDPCDAFR